MKDIESIRNQNIERNKHLLKRLNLKNLNTSIFEDVDAATKIKTQAKLSKSRRISKESTPAVPTRRSRRLANTEEDERVRQKREEEEQKELQRQQNLRDSRLSKLNGSFGWNDLMADTKSGYLLHENSVYGGENKTKSKIEGVSSEPSKAFVRTRVNNSEKTSRKRSSVLKEVRDVFDNKSLFSKLEKDNIKLTPNRITSLNFHPDVNDRIISAGDTSGCLGIWAVDSGYDEAQGNPILLKPHGRTISRIVDVPNCATKFLTASYDGSCRNFDFNKQVVTECVSIEDSEGFQLGVSDMSMVSENLMYISTLEGHFLSHDTREPTTNLSYKDFVRLHDKKIGGFAPNPRASYQIATASLDRTLKLWDLRKTGKQSISSIDDGLSSPINTDIYTSRLSVSNVDWNGNNSLICNGYDDSIRLFDLETSQKIPQIRASPEELRHRKEIRHNCQTGRWVSILKARWQKHPRDGFQKFAIGNMNRSIDIFSETGDKISTLSAESMSAVPAVITFHPSMNWVVGGSSSGKIYLFV